ncbi:MAG: glycosyl hydrolase [Limisphaerales bacterium]
MQHRINCTFPRWSIGRWHALIYLFLVAFVATENGHAAGPSSELEQGFRHPPESARPWVYWFVMDGNLTREGITADFEALKRAGIGGVIMMEVDVGIPRGPVKFMSPEWRALFKHAVAEAERLGLQITLNAGPGWTGSGGPWVKPEQSMQHIVASAVDVTGPEHFDEVLPRPQRRPAFFGDGQLPPELEKAKNDFYRDVVVLAFPTPTGNQRISDIDEKALYVRAPYSSAPNVKARLPSAASYPALPAEAVVAANRVLDLTTKMEANGRLAWDVPEGKWTILRFGRTSNGASTRPAPLPGLGLESDKFDQAALDAHFDAFIGALLREIGPRKKSGGAGWTMLHIDSWEMGAQNWTGGFREEFRRRRGYDPIKYLPTVTGRVVDSLEVSERFLWDLRQTAQELVIENHVEHLKALGHQHGLGLSMEPYDMMPCADLSIGAVVDVPMCEFWLYGFDTTYSVIEAASIGHTCGRKVVAAESFTSGDAERWQAYPGAMKVLGDWAFSAGVNRIVFHRYQHQPWLDRKPGMTMGPYGVHWERTQTWWDMVGAFHEYLARCQFMLRQGLPVADICYLAPEGSPQVFRPPASATRGNPPERLGYNFDGCAPETLVARMSVKKGRLVLPDGMSYRVLVLPEVPTMTPALLRKVRELVRAGATVIGPPPVKSPSLSGYPQCDAEVKKLAVEIWGEGRAGQGSGGESGSTSPPALQHSNTPFAGRHVIWQDDGKTASMTPDTEKPLEQAKWIWCNEGNPAVSAPVGKRYFHRTFRLEGTESIESARVLMSADNSFELWVNGWRAGRGDDFHLAGVFEVKRMLQPGTNVLAVAAENGGDTPNPAGLIGALAIRFRDGHTLTVPTDKSWYSARTTLGEWTTSAFPEGDWSAALELGPLGMAPWGIVQKPAAEVDVFCDYNVVTDLLGKLGVPPDFESDGPIRYTHRCAGKTDLYFVANCEDGPVEASCTFRVDGKAPELWDPLTGQTRALRAFTVRDGRTTVPMRFEAAQSFFVLFHKPSAKSGSQNFPQAQPLGLLTGPWEVAFDSKWGGPGRVTFETLQDWSKRPEDGIKFYSGTAVYHTTFEVPNLPQGQQIYMNLGVVKNLARVRLNGQDLGVVWCAPWRVDITGAVKARDNQLEIIVANLWPNRLIGDQSLPPEKRLTWTTWNPFQKDSPLLESGLLGPVTLLTDQTAPDTRPK